MGKSIHAAKAASVRRSLAAVVASLAAATVLVVGAAPAGAATRPVGKLSPPSGAWFGAFVKPPGGWSQSDVKGAISGIETKLGRRLDIDHHYYGWNTSFPSWKEWWDSSLHRTSMISWAGTSSGSITSGSNDGMIRTRASYLKQFGKAVFLRWFADMDQSKNNALTGSPSAFIAAWRHMHDIFVAQGATNVAWVWCPSAAGFQNGTAKAYYPGAAYVDWVCADGYNLAPGVSGSTWQTVGQIFDPFYKWGVGTAKPLMIGETGVQEYPGTSKKASWVNDAKGVLKTYFPAIEAIVYSQAQTSYDWRMETSSSSMTAFKAMAQDSYFRHSTTSSVSGSDGGGTTNQSLLGAFYRPTTSDTPTEIRNGITKLEADMGRKLDIDHHYYPWSNAFPSWKEDWDYANGRIPMISWGHTTSTSIESGSQDWLITQRADAVKAFAHKVFLRYFWEMDAKAFETDAGTPTDFINAWRRIYNIFHQRGATNAIFVWCPNAYWFSSGRSQTYYPGDGYVDWICADGYNWAPALDGAQWVPFQQIFTPFYTWAAPHNKPLMIGETGAQELNAGDKAQWLTDMANTIKYKMPKVRALVYFDAISGANFGGNYDWRLNTSAASYSTWVNIGKDPYFRPTHASIVPGT
jgi:beta-mannanase